MTESRHRVKLDITVERSDSGLVPWQIMKDRSRPWDRDCWRELVHLFESVWPLPSDLNRAQPGDRFRVVGDAEVVFSTYWTDCGEEHDACVEWEDGALRVEAL
jgi:hypothetical protein